MSCRRRGSDRRSRRLKAYIRQQNILGQTGYSIGFTSEITDSLINVSLEPLPATGGANGLIDSQSCSFTSVMRMVRSLLAVAGWPSESMWWLWEVKSCTRLASPDASRLASMWNAAVRRPDHGRRHRQPSRHIRQLRPGGPASRHERQPAECPLTVSDRGGRMEWSVSAWMDRAAIWDDAVSEHVYAALRPTPPPD